MNCEDNMVEDCFNDATKLVSIYDILDGWCEFEIRTCSKHAEKLKKIYKHDYDVVLTNL